MQREGAITVDDDVLRIAFSPDGDEDHVDRAWAETAYPQPLDVAMRTGLLLNLGVIGGRMLVLYRMVRGRLTAPEEMFWLIPGAAQVVYIIYFLDCYRHEPFPLVYGRKEPQRELWFYPSLTATMAAVVALWRCHGMPGWARLSGLASALLA